MFCGCHASSCHQHRIQELQALPSTMGRFGKEKTCSPDTGRLPEQTPPSTLSLKLQVCAPHTSLKIPPLALNKGVSTIVIKIKRITSILNTIRPRKLSSSEKRWFVRLLASRELQENCPCRHNEANSHFRPNSRAKIIMATRPRASSQLWDNCKIRTNLSFVYRTAKK